MASSTDNIMATLTCLACNVAFDDMDFGRFHYKTDWHRYNLKRKVASLLPITLEQFQDRQKLQEKQVCDSLLCFLTEKI